jgi:hypothetical protein
MDVKLGRDRDFGDGIERGADFALGLVKPRSTIVFEEVEQVAPSLFVCEAKDVVSEFFQMSFPAQVGRETLTQRR